VISARPLELTFEPPPTLPGLRRVVLTVPPASLAALSSAVRASAAAGEPRAETNARAIDAIGAHFARHFGIELAGLRLVRVASPLAMVGRAGRVKVFGCVREALAIVAELFAL
jgi:hypothetical protein